MHQGQFCDSGMQPSALQNLGSPEITQPQAMLKNAIISSGNDKSTRYSTYLAGPHEVHPLLEEQKQSYIAPYQFRILYRNNLWIALKRQDRKQHTQRERQLACCTPYNNCLWKKQYHLAISLAMGSY